MRLVIKTVGLDRRPVKSQLQPRQVRNCSTKC